MYQMLSVLESAHNKARFAGGFSMVLFEIKGGRVIDRFSYFKETISH